MASDLKNLSKTELYELAKEHDVEGRSSMERKELIRALEANRKSDQGDDEHEHDRSPTSGRAVWRGPITFGLITIPVGLYTATEERDISFHMLWAEDHSRIRYKRVSESTGKEVEWDEIVRGYEYEKGRYVVFTDDELDRIPSDSIRAIDIHQFAQQEEIDPIYFEKSYYVGPEEAGVKAYRLFVEALERAGRVGVAKVTIRKKERLCTLRAKDGVLVLETMNWPDEIRIPVFEELKKDVRTSDREVRMAEQLIEQLTDDFDPEEYHDSYRERLEAAIEAKIKGEEVVLAPEEPQAPEILDLMEALRASVEAAKSKKAAAGGG